MEVSSLIFSLPRACPPRGRGPRTPGGATNCCLCRSESTSVRFRTRISPSPFACGARAPQDNLRHRLLQAPRVHVAVAALAGRPELATTSIAGALSSHSAPLGKRLFDHILHISPQQALKDARSFSCVGAQKKRSMVSRKSLKSCALSCARPPPPRKAQPRRAALTLRLAVASRSAFRPSIGMPPPSKASVIDMC